MELTRTNIATILASYYYSHASESMESFCAKLEINRRTFLKWRKGEIDNIRLGSYNLLLDYTSAYLGDLRLYYPEKHEEFWDFFRKRLEEFGFKWELFSDIKSSHKSFSDLMKMMIERSSRIQLSLLETLGTAPIIAALKPMFSPYRDYVSVLDTPLKEEEYRSELFRSWIYCADSAEKTSPVKELNYILLRFAPAYHVAVIFSPYEITQNAQFQYELNHIMSTNHIDLILFVTNQEKIPPEQRVHMMNTFNLFFEIVTEHDLQNISLSEINLPYMSQDYLEQHLKIQCFAQYVFDRIMSYLPVIRNEILYSNWWNRERRNQSRSSKDSLLIRYKKLTGSRRQGRLFLDFAHETLLKQVYNYSYLSRHTIYFERNLARKAADNLLTLRGGKKLDLCVEICAPNAFISADLTDLFETVKLFTSSSKANQVYKELERITQNHFFPPNVSMDMVHSQPDYLTHQYPEYLNGNVDLLILGFGAGSHQQDLMEYIRYAYSWLKEDGILFLSLYNSDSIVLNRKLLNDRRFETLPMYYSDYWENTQKDGTKLLEKLKSYSLLSLKKSYLSRFNNGTCNYYTYPYLSAMINPDDYVREMLDEIREADKNFASQGKHGHFIHVIANKQAALDREELENEPARLTAYLSKHHFSYHLLSHMIAPDSQSLARVLNTKGITAQDTTLVKTILLREIGSNSSYYHVLLPYTSRIPYDKSSYDLVRENNLIRTFGQGVVSPLSVLPDLIRKEEWKGKIVILNEKEFDKPYVVFSAGNATTSVEMKTSDFLEMMKQAGASFQLP